MIYRSIVPKGLAALTLSLAISGTSQANNLITNGGFETSGGYGQVGYNTSVTGWSMENSPSYTFLYNSTNAATGVTGQFGTTALWDSSNNGGAGGGPITASPDGGNFIAQDGDFQHSAITQSLTGLVAGQTYAVSFYWAIAQQEGFNYGTWDYWKVGLGDEYQVTETKTIPQHVFSGWFDKVTMYFTAKSTSEVLSFEAFGGYDGQTSPGSVPPFALLDGVSMEAVPEPASMALMGIGLAGATLFARLRRRMRTA
ncbi:PEP-CTERM sorting domain-containing protein [Aquisphaera insulae]|uniref:PEP-CTERM sorting domain-containing protein n=1 Tax=Aquisphaera insulae TaxID=2712864 RepID=UPI0013EAC1E1|nr:PEP-CTERM sorting domain-containing protein [Aquisphaera insulae]